MAIITNNVVIYCVSLHVRSESEFSCRCCCCIYCFHPPLRLPAWFEMEIAPKILNESKRHFMPMQNSAFIFECSVQQIQDRDCSALTVTVSVALVMVT